MEKFWITALKINLPVTLASYLVSKSLVAVVNNESFISKNPIITLIILILIFNFSALLVLTNLKKRKTNTAAFPQCIEDNKVERNQVKKSMKIQSSGAIKRNTISDNEVGSDLIIGVKEDHD